MPILLDLGAGDKREPGWISVDRTTWTSGAPSPDIIADISQPLPFPDNYADGIRAIHVIEHFYRWEVLDILTDWVRVLKPGSELILECPDVQSCIRNMVKEPENPRIGILGLFGDPEYKSPVMTHKWAYSPGELGYIMHSAGLVDLKHKTAQFHYPVRDMRVVGIKPNVD